MPKEYVDSCFKLEDGPEPGPPVPNFRVKVGWNREVGYVNIATVNEEAPLGTVESGLYVDLNRRGINDLIRHLRRARDQAFGRDE